MISQFSLLFLSYRIAKQTLRTALFFWVIFVAQAGAATIYYFPADFDGSEDDSSDDITQIANYAPICSGDRGPRLPGLNLVRGFASGSVCPGTDATIQFDSDVDYVFLVEDSQQLSTYMQSTLREKNLLKTHRGRQVVDSGVVPLMRDGEDSGLNILVVGETDYQLAGGNETAWFNALSDQTGNAFCEIAADDQSLINDLATQSYQMNETINRTMQDALNNFNTQMSFESSYSATPQVGAALGKEAVKQAKKYIVGKIKAQVPGFDIFVAFVDAANSEIARAEAAARSHSMGQWIIDTRTFISNCLGNSRCPSGASASVEQLTEVAIREHLELAYCRVPVNRKPQALQAYRETLNSSLVAGRSNIKVFEKGFYESWINANYRASALISDSAPGTIEVVWQVTEEDDGTLVFDGDSHVNKVNVADYGDNADDGLNSIISALPDVGQPWDFTVKKKVCFYVDNVMPGGRSRECALLDTDNDVINRIGGSTDMAARAFASDVWRTRTTRFRR